MCASRLRSDHDSVGDDGVAHDHHNAVLYHEAAWTTRGERMVRGGE